MATINIEIPDEVYSEVSEVALQLKVSPAECVQLALSHFLQTHSLESAIEGLARIEDGEELIDFNELKNELGIDVKFHPQAMEELESLSEEDQVVILEEIIDRITSEEEELEGAVDLVLKDKDNQQTILSEFGFGDVVYQIGENVGIYHIAILEEEDEDDEDDMDDEDDLDEAEFDDEEPADVKSH
ncbi:MAG: hypothetical protein ACHQJ6_04315 [Candidatus Berkiellales bacterium]